MHCCWLWSLFAGKNFLNSIEYLDPATGEWTNFTPKPEGLSVSQDQLGIRGRERPGTPRSKESCTNGHENITGLSNGHVSENGCNGLSNGHMPIATICQWSSEGRKENKTAPLSGKVSISWKVPRGDYFSIDQYIHVCTLRRDIIKLPVSVAEGRCLVWHHQHTHCVSLCMHQCLQGSSKCYLFWQLFLLEVGAFLASSSESPTRLSQWYSAYLTLVDGNYT